MTRSYVALFLSFIVSVITLPSAGVAQVALESPAVEEREVAPGESYTGTLKLRNTSREPQEVRIYQTDYQFYADGKTLYQDKGTTPRSNAGWISLSPSHLIIAPGAPATASYRVAVPAGKPLRGTYWSLIMVEAIPPGTPGSSRKAVPGVRIEMGIQSRTRYAVQIATHISHFGSRQVKFARPTVVRTATGKSVLEVDVLNSGDLASRPEISLELYDEKGKPAGKFKQQRGLLYPGSSLRQRFELGSVRKGAYQALVTVDTGDQDVFGAQYTLKF